jgi:hypothetical protein
VSNVTLYVPAGSASAYQSHAAWSGFKEILEIEGTTPTPQPDWTVVLESHADLITSPGLYPSTDQSFTFTLTHPAESGHEVVLEIVNWIDDIEYPTTATYNQELLDADMIRVTVSNITTNKRSGLWATKKVARLPHQTQNLNQSILWLLLLLLLIFLL